MTEMNFRIIVVQQTSEEVKLETCVKEIMSKIEACGLVVNSLNFVNLQNVENENYVEVEELSIHVQASINDNMRLEKRALYEDFCEKWKNQYLPNHCPVLVLYENDSFINRRFSCHCRVSYSNISFGVLPHNGLFFEYASFDSDSYKVDFYHDTRNLLIRYDNYEMRSSYDNIRKIFINIDSCPCEMFLDLCNPFLIFRLERRCNDTNEEYIVDHRAGVLPSNGSKIDSDTLGRSNVLKLSINDLDIAKEIIGRMHFRCSEKPIHYLNVISRGKKLPLDPVIDFFHFGCTYTLTAIIKRNFTMIEQTTNIEAEIARLGTLCKKDGDCLENALINILKAVDSGLIVNLWIEVQKQFTHYLNNKDEINYIHYIVPLKSRMIRRITLTPTRQVLWPPEIMHENRVLRNFDSEYALRISFRDDNMKKLSYCASYAEPCILQSAVKEPMLGGIRIGKRLYEFLAWSNSQIRDHGVWMYARDLNGNTVSDIREWMGDFSDIHSVSKYMARMGQCFSQTEDAISVPLDPSHIRTEDDIEDGFDLVNAKPYCFSEGIGKISVQLANEVHNALGHDKHCSAFQIRYGGYKGMLLIDPTLEGTNIIFRKSMEKFSSPGNTRLEIARTSAPVKLQLNRPFIAILNDLGIRHRTFLKLQEDALNTLMKILFEEEKAASFLLSRTPSSLFPYKELSGSGIYLTTEPYFRSLLLALHRHYGEKLKSKANIPIDPSQGRNMLGVLDETGILSYGEVFIQCTKDISKGETTKDTVIIKGEVIVTKNPCLLPGDVRKFIAVDIPQLHHVVDCIVFPRRGHRPHPNEMAGSDLDGDEYAVLWSPDLIFHCQNHMPGDFQNVTEPDVPIIEVPQMVNFLAKYIKNDQVGIIANAHLAHADAENIFSNKCIRIANKFHIAVDFAKHGRNIHLHPLERPNKFPDFMENNRKVTYKSKKALGKMYRICKDLESENENASSDYSNVQVDPYLVYPGWEKYKDDALKSRNKYNTLLRSVLRNYGIQHEAEAFSGAFTKLHCRFQERNDRAEVEKVIIGCIKRLSKRMHEDFLDEFRNAADINSTQEYILQKASAWYIVTYSDSSTKFLSFPWTVSTYLANIKIKNSSFNLLPVSPLISNMDAQIKLYEAKNILPYHKKTSIWLEYEYLCDSIIVKLASRVLTLWAEEEHIIDKSGHSHTGFLYPNILIKLFLHVAEVVHYVLRKGNSYPSIENKVFSPASLILEFLRFCTALRFYNKNEISNILPFSVYKYNKLAKAAVVTYHRFALSGEFPYLYFERKHTKEKIDMKPIHIDSEIFPSMPIKEETLRKAEDALIKYSKVDDVTMREIRLTKKVCVSAQGTEFAIKELKSILRKRDVLRELFMNETLPFE